MYPADFPESNQVLSRPPDMTEEECDPLCVCQSQMPDGTPVVVSCWKLTKEELEEIQRTGRTWLIVVGHTMPPVIMSGKKPF